MPFDFNFCFVEEIDEFAGVKNIAGVRSDAGENSHKGIGYIVVRSTDKDKKKHKAYYLKDD